jgi:hypothetical protein
MTVCKMLICCCLITKALPGTSVPVLGRDSRAREQEVPSVPGLILGTVEAPSDGVGYCNGR